VVSSWCGGPLGRLLCVVVCTGIVGVVFSYVRFTFFFPRIRFLQSGASFAIFPSIHCSSKLESTSKKTRIINSPYSFSLQSILAFCFSYYFVDEC
jgi:hypothetical protein